MPFVLISSAQRDRSIELTASCGAPEIARRRSCEFTIKSTILQLYCLHASALGLMWTSIVLCHGCNIACIRRLSGLRIIKCQNLLVNLEIVLISNTCMSCIKKQSLSLRALHGTKRVG